MTSILSAAFACFLSPRTGGGTKLHWAFQDPEAAGGTDEDRLAKFREIRDQLDARISTWLSEIASESASDLPLRKASGEDMAPPGPCG